MVTGNSPVYKALARSLSHWLIGSTVWHRLLSPVFKQPKHRDILWTCSSVRVGKAQSPAFHAGSSHSRFHAPIWTKYLTRSTEGFLSLASLKKKKKIISWPFHSVNFDLLGKVSIWTFWKTESMEQDELPDHIHSHGLCDSFSEFYEISKAIYLECLLQELSQKLWRTIYWGLSNHVLWLKNKKCGRRKGGIGKFISFTLHVIVLFWWSFISKLQSTADFLIKQRSLDPPWFFTLLFLPYLETVFHFEPKYCFLDSVANRPPQPCGIITSMAIGRS